MSRLSLKDFIVGYSYDIDINTHDDDDEKSKKSKKSKKSDERDMGLDDIGKIVNIGNAAN